MLNKTHFDPWDPIHAIRKFGKHTLTSIEMTISNLCNMRCEHCAVGDTLVMTEPEKIPLKFMLQRLDEVEHLQTISITGGEPSFRMDTIKDYLIPLLKYARERDLKSQLNSNATLELERYELIAPYLDILHTSFNYVSVDDFVQIGFARANHQVGRKTATKFYERMIENMISLSKNGLFVSTESMINSRTHEKIGQIHQLIAEMGVSRHEVHPMYPSSFASNLPILSLAQLRKAYYTLLDYHDPELWILLGTLPFFSCSPNEEDRKLILRLREEPNLTMRGDPDGRNRLNVNLFTGGVYVTDFADLDQVGNIHQQRLDDVFTQWTTHPLYQKVNCYCDAASCCGPNLLVANAYYQDVDFTQRTALI